jgi:hypothetical protein
MRDSANAASLIAAPNRNVIAQDVFGELLIYDLERNIVRRLNRVAAAIWKECDGQKNVAQIARHATRQIGWPVDEQLVLFALDRLRRAHLLAEAATEIRRATKLSRRELIKRIGIAALPLVTSMAVPTAAQAASCFPALHSCTLNSQCCSGVCVPGVGGIGACA